MKKIAFITALIILLSTNCTFAVDKKVSKFAKFKKSVIKIVRPDKIEKVVVEGDKQATFLYNSNEVIKAFDMITKIPEEKRTSQDWLLLGNVLQDQGKTLDAEFMYKRAIMTNPEYYKPYYNLGNLYLDSEKPNLAIQNFKKAKDLNEEFSYADYNMGCAYIKLGNLKKAKLYFLRAIALKNNEPDFYNNLIYTYKKLGKEKDAKKYLEIYNKLLEINN